MAAHTFVFLFCVRVVDGGGAGVQRLWRYPNAYVYQPGIFLVHPDPHLLVHGHKTELAAIRCVLGRVHLRNLGRVIHPLALQARRMETGEGVRKILFF